MHGRPTTQPLGHTHASHPNRWRILGVLVLALLVTSIDHTIINVAMPRLVEDLGRQLGAPAVDRRLLHRSSSPVSCSPREASATASDAGTRSSPASPRSWPGRSSPPPRLDDRADRRSRA